MGNRLIVSSVGPHFGEEPPLVGRNGSGTIFFAGCNLLCTFCQNYAISHERRGNPVSTEELAAMMIDLQEMRCHNINLVTPTHVAPYIVSALVVAIDRGLAIPLVYNCGGYESVDTLRYLDGIVDIYMPDFKYWENEHAFRFSGVRDYRERACEAFIEMHRQVGELALDEWGVATRGLLIRHLVLPEGLAGTESVLQFIAAEISKDSYVNIMDQYHPAFEADREPHLNRRITREEFRHAIETAKRCGLHRGFDG
jgi:putative pyruvate formate lyase activating enzyme